MYTLFVTSLWAALYGGVGGGNDASYVFKGILHFSFLFSDPQFSEIYHYAGRRARESPTYEVCKKGGIALLMFDNLLR